MKDYLSMIKFSHTIFAMPFAMAGYFIGVHSPHGNFEWMTLGLVLLCMVFARNAAMAFNRYLDKDIDALNPRTAMREIPSGIVSPKSALIFVTINCLAFILTTFFINKICFFLSPVALLVILGYSYTKRFTPFCHLVLGLGLALAPIGAYLAVTGRFDLIPFLLGMAVLFWVSGFDIIYALQDVDFDQENNLHSTPVWLGKSNALVWSKVFHGITAICIVIVAFYLSQNSPNMGIIHWAGAIIFIIFLIYQHTLIKPNDFSKINLAFFTTNGMASLIFGTLLILDYYI